MDSSTALDGQLFDGVVAAKSFIEEFPSMAQHPQEGLDEDDAFLGSASPEVWEYEVVNERQSDFEEALSRASEEAVLEYEVIDEDVLLPEDALEASNLSKDGIGEQSQERRNGGHEATGQDGPAGQPTVDRSAGGLNTRRGSGRTLGPDDLTSDNELDSLSIRDAGDPSLGLTDGTSPNDDWAADTGASRNATQGLATDVMADESSTLGPARRRRSGGNGSTPRKNKK